MTDEFDPNEVETEEDWNRYIEWCGTNLDRMLSDPEVPRNMRAATYCAQWMHVVAACPLHLADDYDPAKREDMEGNLVRAVKQARCIERDHGHVTRKELLVERNVLNMWTPVGGFAGHLLDATKCAVTTIIALDFMAMVMPADALATLDAPEMFAMIDHGYDLLSETWGAVRTPADFAVLPRQGLIDALQYERLNEEMRRVGGPEISPN